MGPETGTEKAAHIYNAMQCVDATQVIPEPRSQQISSCEGGRENADVDVRNIPRTKRMRDRTVLDSTATPSFPLLTIPLLTVQLSSSSPRIPRAINHHPPGSLASWAASAVITKSGNQKRGRWGISEMGIVRVGIGICICVVVFPRPKEEEMLALRVGVGSAIAMSRAEWYSEWGSELTYLLAAVFGGIARDKFILAGPGLGVMVRLGYCMYMVGGHEYKEEIQLPNI